MRPPGRRVLTGGAAKRRSALSHPRYMHLVAIILIDHFRVAAHQDAVSGVPKRRVRSIVRRNFIDAARVENDDAAAPRNAADRLFVASAGMHRGYKCSNGHQQKSLHLSPS